MNECKLPERILPGHLGGDPESVQLVLQARRDGLHQRLQQGASGSEVVTGFTDLVDAVLIGRYRNVVRQQGAEATLGMQYCCLVAVGGYGRRELAPYSDIDVMLVFHGRGEKVVTALSTQIFHHLWDVGFQVGHSVRSLSDCLAVAEQDLAARTALMESRFLAGSVQVFQDFQRRFTKRILGRHVQRFIKDKVEERQREYTKFGETIYLLEPNIKKTKGGLRDLHLLQWVGMAKYRATTLRELANRGLLAHQDYLALLEARDYLWRIRAFLHLQAGRAQDILSFEEQVRLAREFGFRDHSHLLAVEQFMQRYYQHTTGIYERCMRFIDRVQEPSWWVRWKSWWPVARIEGCFYVSGSRLTIHPEKLVYVLENPEWLLRFFREAQLRDLMIDGGTLEEIHRHMESMPDHAFCTEPVSRLFRQILSGPGPIGSTLELMHHARVLEKVVPAFARVRGLMQFNQYHKYTVDEHSLLAVKEMERLGREPGIFRTVYEEIRHKDLLHLALLLHDLGKGLPGDHSEMGLQIAREMAARLQLDQHEARTLEFLVHHHLLMANTAFRRDPSDEKILLTFARAVGTPEMLKKLFLLTAADLAAVGPGSLTKWKEALLVELYSHTLPEVSGGREATDIRPDLTQMAADLCTVLLNGQHGEGDLGCDTAGIKEWVTAQLEKFPLRYLSGTSRERMAAHFKILRRLEPGGCVVESWYHPQLHVCEYTLITYDDIIPGIFMNVAGVLAAKGLQVLDAQILTRDDGIVVDTFVVEDRDFDGAPPPERLQSVGRTIVRVLQGEESVLRIMERHRRLPFTKPRPLGLHPTEVQIDNETSDQYTIIDVFADDCQGLLYVIARTLFELHLAVHAARISTRLDQVVDVFYVTDARGAKIDGAEACEVIRNTVQTKVDQFLQTGRCPTSFSSVVSDLPGSSGC
ncbi:MAG: [protein-PII] uridylyltransferase [Nitrospirae bacterium]|nr:MAG: [protein-PII] uridylyltransferase [Nitrospirota bacterium]